MSLATTAAAGRRLASPTRRPWLLWRSPKDQPDWARLALLVVATLAGLSYSWGIGNFALEPFYGAAVRSMGSSWRDFAFGAVDPAGTVTLDKLPGAFWVQALFVRFLGFHYWVVALPQVLAGVLTVLVLYRAVRRLGGAKAGIVAAAVFAASPAATLAMRGNVADPILVLLLALAADATTAAVTDGRPRLLLLAGVLVGLAFQVKMVQAWLVLPPLFLAYLVAAPPCLGRRAGHVFAAGAIAVVVSLSWMSVVAAIPANRRPYVDGTTNDSVFSQVFVYNGVSRIGLHLGAGTIVSSNSPFFRALNSSNPEITTLQAGPSPDKLFVGALGRDGGWLLALALVIALGVLVERRRAPRGDRQRAAVLLWGGWLVVLAAFFSSGRYINSYYLVALVPAIAALCGIGFSAVWDGIARRPNRLALAGLVAACAGYALLLVASSAGHWWWLVVLGSFVALAGIFATLAAPWRWLGLGLAGVSLLVLPAATTGLVVAQGLGAFSTPFQRAAVTRYTTKGPESFQRRELTVTSDENGIVSAVYSTALAAPWIMVTGEEYLPIGGYTGENPAPSLAALEHLVASGRVSLVFIPGRFFPRDPRLLWVREHCSGGGLEPAGGTELGEYYCLPSSVRG